MFFLSPLYILLFLLLIFVLVVRMKRSKTALRYSAVFMLDGLSKTWRVYLSKYLWTIQVMALVLVIFALMRLQAPVESSKIENQGIDIALAIDCSSSMLAEDFIFAAKRHNRLEAVKRVVRDFIHARKSDRLGLVAFAGRAYTVCPLTFDYAWLVDNLERMEIGLIEEDGTAVGSAIATSLKRLKDSEAKSKVLVLLTDGRNNAGSISPYEAAELAKALDIKIYTIGAGKKGTAPFPARDFFGNKVYRQIDVDIDEDILREVAQLTGGKYFRATDMASLKDIYKEIDELETSSIEEKGYAEYKELFPFFLVPAIILLLLEMILSNTVLRRLP